MGYFSDLCAKCGKSINMGESTHIFLLRKSEVIAEVYSMSYDCYGESHQFENYLSPVMNWLEMIDLHFSFDKTNGFCFYHEKCYHQEKPDHRTENANNQGMAKPRKLYSNIANKGFLTDKHL